VSRLLQLKCNVFGTNSFCYALGYFNYRERCNDKSGTKIMTKSLNIVAYLGQNVAKILNNADMKRE
jgi:hypothetical protein